MSYNKQSYPGWAELIGWIMALASMSLIPGFAIYQIWKTPGTLREVFFSTVSVFVCLFVCFFLSQF